MLTDHRIAQVRFAESAQRKRRVADQAGEWFRSLGPADWFVTITLLLGSVGDRSRALERVKEFLGELEQDAGNDIGWIMAEAYEHFPRGLHFHVLIQGVSHLRRRKWWQILHERFGRSQILPYDDSLGGASYVAKNALSEDADLHFGGGLWDPAKGRFRGPHQVQKRAGRDADEKRKTPRKSSPLHHPPAVTKPGPFRIYVDGAGKRPDGKGSGYAFFNQTTGREGVKWVHGLTGNEAEYRGLRYALRNMPEGSEAEVFSDSQLMVAQFRQQYGVRKPELEDLLLQVYLIIQERRLRITLTWIPRQQNLADRLLRRRTR